MDVDQTRIKNMRSKYFLASRTWGITYKNFQKSFKHILICFSIIINSCDDYPIPTHTAESHMHLTAETTPMYYEL